MHQKPGIHSVHALPGNAINTPEKSYAKTGFSLFLFSVASTFFAKHYDGFLFRVYNRWGECIYTDDNYKNTWSPQNISDGVYWVIAQNPSSGTWFKQAVSVFTGK